jgi:drug/metabolite transporter (DMT)-like permease
VNELVAVLAAIAASITFGASDVIEQRATHEVAERKLLDPRLFVDLLGSRLWRVGIAVDISASAMQAVALRFGPLSLVQPILVCDLLFAALMAAALAHRRPDRVMVAGVLCCTGGLALFEAVARPSGGKATVSPTVLLPLGAFLAVAIAICPIVARFSPKKGLPLATAFACGAVFGVTAFLLKEITQTIGHGFNPPSQQWALYAFIILEPIGFLLNQNAFQESTLIAPVLAIRTVTDPLVAIGIGLLFLNETIASGPAAIVAEVVGLAIMSVGVYALAHRSPQLAAQKTAAQKTAPT